MKLFKQANLHFEGTDTFHLQDLAGCDIGSSSHEVLTVNTLPVNADGGGERRCRVRAQPLHSDGSNGGGDDAGRSEREKGRQERAVQAQDGVKRKAEPGDEESRGRQGSGGRTSRDEMMRRGSTRAPAVTATAAPAPASDY